MILNENKSIWSKWPGWISSGLLILAVAGVFTITGCSGFENFIKKSGDTGSSEDVSAGSQPEDRIAQLESRNRDLEKEVRDLKVQVESEKAVRDSVVRRLETAQAAREEAVREVVRMRARMQGMASRAEASAMFAEARVILDRMDEEAFNADALEDLDLAGSYMAEGKKALDSGNPGGAAYLFDLITGLYEKMRKADPRTVTVKVSSATLRKSPSPTSPRTVTLYWGESATGIKKTGDWMQVKTSSGESGWLMRSQVR